MTTEKQPTVASMQPFVMRLFCEGALTISKSGAEVRVQCENEDDANAVFEWFADMRDDTGGDPIGWKIVSIGNDGSVLCQAPNGRRARYWFIEKCA